MRHFRDIPISRKILLLMMVASSTVLLLAGAAFLTNDIITLRHDMSEDLTTLTEVVGANSAAAVVFNDSASANETLGFLNLHPHVVAATINTPNGDIFAQYKRSQKHTADRASRIAAWLPVGDKFIESTGNIGLQGDHLGTITIRTDTEKLRARLLWYAVIASSVFLFSMLVAYLLSSRLQRVVTEPIRLLAATAHRVSEEENYSIRATPQAGRDELGNLVTRFNEMLDEIQARDDELEIHSEQLEEMVSRRTSELQTANAQLAVAKEHAEATAEKMAHQAYHDALTNLPNRALLNDRLVVALAHSQREDEKLAVLFLDLDRFKVINDSLGHAIGDDLLCTVAARLQHCIRADDTVARVGGDEFMVLLPSIDGVNDAGRVAQKILDTLQKSMICEGHELHITTSIGISIYPTDGTDSGTLMKQADISMYRAKERGRNNYLYYTADMDALSHHRLIMENNLRKALEREELQIVYQPKVNTVTHAITGVEALLRWHHPDMGLVPPSQFIPLAEETGLIVPIGEWMMHSACMQSKAWEAMGIEPMRMAVNLSVCQLGKHYLLDVIRRVLDDVKLDPSNLELEITESVVMQNAHATINTLRELKDMGIQLSIDDFGTGYSSLSYLRRFPIDSIKIDSSFIREIPYNTEDASIAKAILAMAQSLKLKVVAEGVENDRQLHFLREHGCDEVQGYLFGAPVPGDDILQMLQRQNTPAPLGAAE